MEIKFLKKGMKVNGQYFPVFYSSPKNNINGNATVYLRTYDSLPEEARKIFNVENSSDSQTDYFEKDRIRIAPTSPYFSQIEALVEANRP